MQVINSRLPADPAEALISPKAHPPMISIKTRRKAVTKVFGEDYPAIEDDSYVNFLFQRRDCAVVQDGRHRDLQYIVEFDEQDAAISAMLETIAKRDGRKIAREVADRLICSIRTSKALL